MSTGPAAWPVSATAETEDATAADGWDLSRVLPPLGLGVLYLATVLGGLALTNEIEAAGIVAFEDPESVANVGYFAVIIVAFTAITIAAQRLGYGMQLIRLYMLGVFGMLVGDLFVVMGYGTHVAGVPTSPLALAAAGVTVVVLWVYPEWYVVDVAAVVGGAVIIPMMGLSFAPLPIVILLVAWAGYDAYSVYVSGHMQELAGGLGELKAPMMYVVPYTLEFSLVELDDLGIGPKDEEEVDANADATGETAGDDDLAGPDDPGDTEDQDRYTGAGDSGEGNLPVTFLGLGDAIIPGMLAVSAGHFLDAPVVVEALNANLPAIGALVGGVVGLGALLLIANKFEGVHAGLPPLNAGVLGGYLVGAVLADVPITAALGI